LIQRLPITYQENSLKQVVQEAIDEVDASARKYVELIAQSRELEAKAIYLEKVESDDDMAKKKLDAAFANRSEAKRIEKLAAGVLNHTWDLLLNAEEQMEWVRDGDEDCVRGTRVFFSRQALRDARLGGFAGRMGVLECRNGQFGVWEVSFPGMDGEEDPKSMGIEILVGAKGQHWLVYAESRFQRAANRSQSVLIAEKNAMMAWSQEGGHEEREGVHAELIELRRRVKAARLVADLETVAAHRPTREQIAWTTALCGGHLPPELHWPDQSVVDSDACCTPERWVILSPAYFTEHPEQEVYNGVAGRLVRKVWDGAWSVRFPKGLTPVDGDLVVGTGPEDDNLLYLESVFAMMAEAHPPSRVDPDPELAAAARRAMKSWFPAGAAELVLEDEPSEGARCVRGAKVLLSLTAQDAHREYIGLIGMLSRRVRNGLWTVRFPGLKDGLTDWKTSARLRTGQGGQADLVYAEQKLAQGVNGWISHLASCPAMFRGHVSCPCVARVYPCVACVRFWLSRA
jgi:hypothetical protein